MFFQDKCEIKLKYKVLVKSLFVFYAKYFEHSHIFKHSSLTLIFFVRLPTVMVNTPNEFLFWEYLIDLIKNK